MVLLFLRTGKNGRSLIEKHCVGGGKQALSSLWVRMQTVTTSMKGNKGNLAEISKDEN